MVRTILGAMGVLVALALAVASVGLLIWLLWWLWTHRSKETEPIEVELELPEAEIADIEERAETLEIPEEETMSEEAEEPDLDEGLSSAAEAEATEEPEAKETEDETLAEAQASEERGLPPASDKLTRIEGIGPKISSVLQEAGITTFAQLADATPEQIEQILAEADPRLPRLANPATWPEQAALAATGEWEALAALQKEFKRGKRG
jgi:predicted flap endonuclease-1-like 5' DNA nuclease